MVKILFPLLLRLIEVSRSGTMEQNGFSSTLVRRLRCAHIHPHLQTRKHKYTHTQLLKLTNTTTHPHTKQIHTY